MAKRLIIIISITLGIIVILFFGIQAYGTRKIRSIIVNDLSERTHGRYSPTVDKVNFNLLGRSVDIRGLEIEDRSDSLSAQGLGITGTVEKVRFGGVKILKLVNMDAIEIRSVSLINPDLTFIDNKREQIKKSAAGQDSIPVYPGKSVDLNLQKIKITDGNIKYINKHGEQPETAEFHNIRLTAQNFRAPVDSIGTFNFIDKTDVTLSCDSISRMSTDGSLLQIVTDLKIDTRNKTLHIGSFNIIPQYDMYNYAYKRADHADWTKFVLHDIDGEGFELSKEERLVIQLDKITVGGGSVESYKNRKIKRIEKRKELLSETVQGLPVDIYIGTIDISGMRATYHELSEKGDKPGTIFFTNLTGTMKGLTNMSGRGSTYSLHATGNLMGQGRLTADFTFPVTGDKFSVKGSLGSIKLSALNAMIEPLASIELDKGEINSIVFNISGNSHSSHLNMTMLYDGLDVDILKDGRDRKFLSWVVNKIVLKSENPDKNGTRTANGTAVRDPYRSQFNYLWRTLLVGLKATIGVPGSDGEVTHVDENGELKPTVNTGADPETRKEMWEEEMEERKENREHRREERRRARRR